MKYSTFLFLCATTLLVGCESVSSRMHERFSTVPPQTRTFAAERRAVFNAGQVAVKNIGLIVGRKSLSNGVIEAYAPIRAADATQDARQTALTIHFTENDAGDTDVAVLVSDHTEGSFPGGVSEQDLREHSLYGMYFAALQQVLLENGAIKPVGKP